MTRRRPRRRVVPAPRAVNAGTTVGLRWRLFEQSTVASACAEAVARAPAPSDVCDLRLTIRRMQSPSIVQEDSQPRRVRLVRMDMVVLALLAGATMLTHGWSLGDGLFLDDHWHQIQLRDRGWSWTDLLETTTLDPDEFMETWWQEHPIRWQYARPVSVLLMKAVYRATGGHVGAQHFTSIALHFANAGLVYLLCM